MELRDFLVTPFYFTLFLALAYWIRPLLTDKVNRIYFMPAILAKLGCALALGFLYQFYYHGGDTYNFHTYGSRIIWNAFIDDPGTGIKLLLPSGEYDPHVFKYSSHIPFYYDKSAIFIIRIAAVFDLFTFSAYSATALWFAFISFLGCWMFFLTFYEIRPHLHPWIALAILFVPSVLIWGSGLLKDTLTLAFLGFFTWSSKKIFIERKIHLGRALLLLFSFYVIFHVKKYIILCFLPAILLWIFSGHFSRIRSVMLKIMLMPFILALIMGCGYFAILQIGKDDPRYALENLAVTAQVTAYDIGFYTGGEAGSGYNLGELDGTFKSMLALLPQAINVSLFRPYLWEVKNPLMLLSALESFVYLGITLYALYRGRWHLHRTLSDPTVLFCLVFALTFAFAVGISTYNFGTLSRYKIPLIPFYGLVLLFMLDYKGHKDP